MKNNQQELIKQIEKEIHNTKLSLNQWEQKLTKYTLTLEKLTNQLNTIKKQLKENNK